MNESMLAKNNVKPKVTIAVIARLKSTRLKKKALLPINGVESIKRCLLNCLAAKKADHVVLATSYLEQDEPLTTITLDGRVITMKGDPENVASRVVQAADLTGADIVLRVTGDCPAVSPEMIDYLIDCHLKSGADLTLPTSNHAIGTGADVYSVTALKRLLTLPVNLDYIEYLSFYFVNNPKLFKIDKIELPDEYRYPQWRLTLDEEKDYQMFNELYSGLNIGEEPVYFSKIREYLLKNPQITEINAQVPLKYRDDAALVKKIYQATTLTFE